MCGPPSMPGRPSCICRKRIASRRRARCTAATRYRDRRHRSLLRNRTNVRSHNQQGGFMPTHKARPGRSGPELTNDELRRIDFLHNAVDAALRSIVQNTIGQAYEHDMAITGPVAEAIAEAISIKYGVPFDELYPSIRDDDGSPPGIEKRGALCGKGSGA